MSEPVIEIDNLNFSYPDGREVLKNINLTVFRGETLAIIGPNGAGKSTLLLHLNGILHRNGSIKILGEKINDRNIRRIRAKVGLVFQNPDDQLFCPLVYDDVAFGPLNMGYPPQSVREKVESALAEVGMSGFEHRASHHLSLGEKKRIAIATVLSMNPEILVFDEPTSNLDPRARWLLLNLLRRLPATKIIATHDLDMVRLLCERTVVLDNGQILADGPTDSILNDIELLKKAGLAP